VYGKQRLKRRGKCPKLAGNQKTGKVERGESVLSPGWKKPKERRRETEGVKDAREEEEKQALSENKCIRNQLKPGVLLPLGRTTLKVLHS